MAAKAIASENGACQGMLSELASPCFQVKSARANHSSSLHMFLPRLWLHEEQPLQLLSGNSFWNVLQHERLGKACCSCVSHFCHRPARL